MIMLLVLLSRWKVMGKENVPSHGGLLIVANHISMIDPPLVSASIRRRVAFLAKEALFRKVLLRWFFTTTGAVPVYKGHSNRRTLQQSYRLLEQEQALLMFPEGSRSPDVKLQKALSGSALIAIRSKVPVLPIGITGTERLRVEGWFLRRPEIKVNIGPVFNLNSSGGKMTKKELIFCTESVMENIARLLPEKYRGYYDNTNSKVDADED